LDRALDGPLGVLRSAVVAKRKQQKPLMVQLEMGGGTEAEQQQTLRGVARILARIRQRVQAEEAAREKSEP
jgi:hypothetical protein